MSASFALVSRPLSPSEQSAALTAARNLTLSDHAVRYALILILGWMGAMKFTGYEAEAIQGLVASSPLMSWLYGIGCQQTVSNGIGVIELVTAAALAVGPFNRAIAIFGAALAVAIFSVTLSFLFTAPGWEASLGGFPALSVVPGQFLLKDLVLWTVSISLLVRAINGRR
ncbi:YkgB family protein [Elongatibacter sediminis]|uniref:DUF417 family protein n=1 Tax=Elongatibacter sediminis TaxID=3119006 RepID=A0AAW9RB20_9GAMM